jgi:FKBP-type peptidyl-prolyl cis-trans isomerase
MNKLLLVGAAVAMLLGVSSCSDKNKSAEATDEAATATTEEAAPASVAVTSPTDGNVNLKAGQAFLAENARRPGVHVTESGLQYEILVKGDGPKPTVTDVVRVHYTGKLIDETVFDSSVERGEPAVFGVSQVIPGWIEALKMMPVGSKWRLFIPSNLAYGEDGAGGVIGPNETLVFDVELLGIVGK